MKSEPDAWSWDQQVKKGAKGEPWTGVRYHSAKLNLMKMKKGDRGFFYHSNIGKEVVGIVAGRGLGASALAALTTRGFAELTRFGRAYGARAETMMGLSGLGDLILTCSTPQSRNFSYGVALGKGEPPPGKLAEGVFTAPVLLEMAREKDVEMPISAAIAAVLSQELSVDQAIESLMTRPFRAE